jgi:hypothetical protein
VLRVVLQFAVASALLSQREGLALTVAGLVMLLELGQDRRAGRAQDCCGHACGRWSAC